MAHVLGARTKAVDWDHIEAVGKAIYSCYRTGRVTAMIGNNLTIVYPRSLSEYLEQEHEDNWVLARV